MPDSQNDEEPADKANRADRIRRSMLVLVAGLSVTMLAVVVVVVFLWLAELAAV